MRASLSAPWRAVSARLGPQPTRLVIVPPELRTLDPAIAEDVMAGHYALGGKVVSIQGVSPFAVADAPPSWTRALYELFWLRHLTTLDSPAAREQARAILADLVAMRTWPAGAQETRSVARRLISLIAAAPYLLDGADAAYYKTFLRCLARHGRRLQRALVAEHDPLARLQAGVALLHLALSIDRSERLARRAIAAAGRELDAQIAADGSHVGRNPETAVVLLFDLIPLRQCFVRRGVEPPLAILNAIDRMLAMVRHMRHADGALAAFNGAGGAPRDLLAALIAYGDAAAPASPGLRGGYARLVGADAVVLVDAAAAGPVAATAQAHAGCLSFEFSTAGKRWIVNCGAPRDHGARLDDDDSSLASAMRTTITHSTATLGNATSAQFIESPAAIYLAGPPGARAALSADGLSFDGAHDGYRQRFGLRHERRIALAADGASFSGRDSFPGEPVDHVPAALRFHLHPAIEPRLSDDDSFVLLIARDGETWRFSAGDAPLEIEESIYLGDGAPRRTMQIVVRLSLSDRRHVAWLMERIAHGRGYGDG